MSIALSNTLSIKPDTSSTYTFDFMSGAIDNRLSLTRASSATYVNSSGLIATASSNEWRQDYYPTLNTLKGVLREPQSTNLRKYSEQFDNSYWTSAMTGLKSFTTGGSVADATTSPDGRSSADYIREDTSTGFHRLQLGDAIPIASTPYSFSVWLKKAERDKVRLQLDTGSDGIYVEFDLSNGTKGSITSVGTPFTNTFAYMIPFPNGWYRCIVGGVTAKNTAIRTQVRLTNGTTDSYTGTGTSGCYVWGLQLESLAYPTSYIKTTSASATRAEDVVSFNSSAIGYPVTSGTIYTQTIPFNLSTSGGWRIISINDGSISNEIFIGGANTGAQSQCGIVVSDSATNSNTGTTPNGSTVIKEALSFTNANSLCSINGTNCSNVSLTALTPMPSGLTSVTLFKRPDNTYQFNGWLQKLNFSLSTTVINLLQTITT